MGYGAGSWGGGWSLFVATPPKGRGCYALRVAALPKGVAAQRSNRCVPYILYSFRKREELCALS